MEHPTSDYQSFRFAMSTVNHLGDRRIMSEEIRDLIETGSDSWDDPVLMTLDPVLHSTSVIFMTSSDPEHNYEVTVHATFDVTKNSKFTGGYIVEYFPSLSEFTWAKYDRDHLGDFLVAVVSHGS